METTLNSIHEQQKDTWNKFSGGWEKWDNEITNWLQPVADQIIEHANLENGQKVLDVATGSGEPGLTIAKKFSQSKVIGMDISEEMLKVAKTKAKNQNVLNYSTLVNNESDLPFDENTFDAIVSRFGIMFFADINIGLHNLLSVLKPGGMLSVAVWGLKEKNPSATTIAKIVMQELQLQPPPADAPGIFRCEEEGMVAEIIKNHGLKNVTEEKISGIHVFDSPEHYWELLTDIAAPISKALATTDIKTRLLIRKKAMDASEEYRNGEKIEFPWLAYVIRGEK